jgi:hypothetical protein
LFIINSIINERGRRNIMKKSLKILVVVLVIVMAFGISTTAFAADFGGPGGEGNYFNGTVSNYYFTGTSVVRRDLAWDCFRDYMYGGHFLVSDGTSVDYTSRLYATNQSTQASNMVYRSPSNFNPIDAAVNGNCVLNGTYIMKIDNTYYRGQAIEFHGKWYIINP